MKQFIVLLFFCVCSIASADDADTAFARKDYTLARDLYVQNRDRFYEHKQDEQWKQASVQIVRCSTALGETDRSVQEYLLLCRKDPLPPLEYLPLPWFVPLDKTLTRQPYHKQAEDFLNDVRNPCPAGKLLAAAVLSVCSDNQKRLRGSQILRDIAAGSQDTAEQKQVVLLATAFLWKQKLPMYRSAADLKPLQNVLAQIPEPLCAGPYFVLGEVAAQVNLPEDAVLYWMRLPILFPENKELKTEGLRRSAETLEKLGRRSQAEHLQNEM
ncbi:MAG: hypothetical protein LBN39_04910 [Planctomycetaceae bacterium]|jgi:hypothetical protein|nr:hypothetical protein [Planctomycetaceae bacterium]